MNIPHSDALVFFGATGDLIYKKIFPALYAMERRAHLQVPVIGVARSGWTIEQFRARARASVEKHGGDFDEGSSRGSRSGCTTSAATMALRPPTPHSAKRSAVRHTRCTISQSLLVCSRTWSRDSASRAAPAARA